MFGLPVEELESEVLQTKKIIPEFRMQASMQEDL
jgi:ribosomal protein L29